MDLKAKISNLFSQTDSGAGGRKQVANSLDGLVDSLPGGVVQLLALLIQDTGGLFELVLTTPSQTVERMHVELLDSRRWAAFSLEEASLRKILVRLRNTLAALPPSSHRPENLARQGVLLDNTIAVLDAVRRLKLEENTRPELRHKKGTTNNTRPPPRIEIIEQIFVAAHSKIPETPDQARRLIATMRERLLHILRAYIGALQYPDVAKHVRTLHSSTSLLNGEGISTKDDIDFQSYWNRPIFPVGSLAALALEGQLPYAADGLELGEWPVVMSHRVFRRLCQISSEDANTFSIVLRKISELSQGLFSDTNHVRIRDNGVAIFKALLFGDQRLIYQIDIGAPVALGKYESQFLRLFDICSVARVADPFWSDVARQLGRRGNVYIKNCKAQKALYTGGLSQIRPAVVPRATVGEDLEDEPVEPLKLDEKQYLELHRILATEKFIRLSQASLNIVVSDEPHKEDLDMAFAVSPQEHDIICHESSSLVLGRGGTGKTSTMLLKMLLLERAENNLDRPIRQVFITQSPSLVNKVEAYYKKLVHSSSGSSAERCTRETDVVTDLLLRSMDQELIKDKLPPGTKFGDLDDSHFPLFVTFNEFYKLLESEYNLHERPVRSKCGPRHPFQRETPLSFDYFVAEIWPRLNEQTKKGLHPALLFSEFMGVIKGSSNTLTAGYLDRETYESLSSRTYSTFNDDRGRIYTLFEAYRKLKPAQLVDAADRAHALIKALKSSEHRPQFDYIYIDEIQDNMLIDAAVLNLVCRNPHGLFYAGDTAQTISVGSSFRFKDLKRFLYQVEHTEPLVVAGKRRPVNPTFFELSVNYRSHAGIINLAAFIVSLISHAFPNAIDMLRREKALAPGPKPVFFLGRTDEEALTRLLSESDHNDAIELGAGQVVVVRNEEVRAALRQRLGGSVLIMTLYETKGLEFNDVVLYNFFADSMASPSNWRALSSVTRDASTSSSSSAGRFQEHQHRILQSELKSLYVAVTRAREHVWVWDESEKGEDFVTFLLQRNYIELHERYATVPRIAVKTSTREWGMQGRELFRKRLYTEASTSFRKAQLPWLQQVSEVYADRETVRKLPSVTVGRRSRSQQLGDRFGNLAATARNLNDAQDIYTQAARCYVDAAEDARAAEMFLLAAKYTDATWHYRLARRLDDAIHVVLEYGEHVCQEVKETVTYLAKVAYTKQSETKKALSLFPKIKDYVEFLHDHGFEKQAILVLEEHTAYDEAAEVCIASGQYAKAVDLLLRCKTDTATRRAASCLLDALRKEMPFGAGIRTRGANVAGLLELMRKLNLQIDEYQEMDLFHALYRGQPADLFDLNHRYRYSGKYLRWDLLAFDGYLRDVRTLISSQTSMANLIGVLEAFIEYGRRVRGIARIHDIVGEEDLHHTFGISHTTALQSTHASLPGSLADDAPLICVVPISPIYTDALDAASSLTATPGLNGSGSGTVLPRHIVNALIREHLLVRLNSMLFDLHTHLKGLGRLHICLPYALRGHCDRAADGQSCELLHSETRYESAEAFNERFRVHLLLITALDNFTAIERRKRAIADEDMSPEEEEERNRKFYQRYWLARLFQVCYPATLSMSNITHIIPAAIPEFNSIMAVLRQWIQEVLRNQSPRTLSPHMISDMLMASILAAHFDFQAAQRYAHRSYIDFKTCFQTGYRIHRFTANAIQNSLRYLFRREPQGRNTSHYTLRHIIEKKPGADLNVVMSFIEDICIQAVCILTSPREGRPRHILLPRSWLIRALGRADPTWHDRSLVDDLVTALGALLIMLITGDAGRLHINGRPISGPRPSLARNMLAARACQLLAILVYNLGDLRLQSRVLQCLMTLKQAVQASLRHDLPSFPQEADILQRSSNLIRPFITSNTWTDVMRAFQLSMGLRGPDELILAFNQLSSTVIIPGIRRIQYFDAADLYRQLTTGTQVLFLSIASWDSSPHLLEDATTTSAPVDQLDDVATLPPDATLQEPNEPPMEEAEDYGYEEEERKAAPVIQQYFARYRKRTSGGKAGPTWDLFHERSIRLRAQGAGHESNFIYHIYLQGPLPRVMETLSVLRSACHHAKKAVDRVMRASRNEIMEDSIIERRSTILALAKDVTSLIATLSPDSALHDQCSVERVTLEVQKVPKLCARMAEITKNNPWPASEDYQLGVYIILTPSITTLKKTPAKLKKPKLNTEDLDIGDFY